MKDKADIAEIRRVLPKWVQNKHRVAAALSLAGQEFLARLYTAWYPYSDHARKCGAGYR